MQHSMIDSNRQQPPMPPNIETTPYTYTSAGAEPGIHINLQGPSHANHFKEDCVIELAEYDAEHVSVKGLTNNELVETLRETSLVQVDEDSECVRWINIGGIDWEVMSALGVKYNLHALTLEDILHEQGHNHSKADYYHSHLFIRILSHTLQHDHPTPHKPPTRSSTDDSALERGQLTKKNHVVHEPPASTSLHTNNTLNHSHLKPRLTGLSGIHTPARLERLLKIRALTKGDHLNVHQEPLFIFLTRKGNTVISVCPTPSLDFGLPITERLHNPDSVLRTSSDASLLVESLLDLVVDRVLEVTDAYQDRILKLEHDVLRRHGTGVVRSLHVLSGDIILHRRMLEPMKAMIYGLRRYDVDRCIALADDLEAAEPEGEGPWVGAAHRPAMIRKRQHPLRRDEHGGTAEAEPEVGRERRKGKVKGYLSYKSKVYLADVYDHIDYALASLDMFAEVSENLVNYAFNTASYEMNEVMRRLTLATIIFLPLTILTGYFGMNFHPFPAVDNHSDLLFWQITLPAMVALVPVFMMLDIRRVVGRVERWVWVSDGE